MVKEVLEERGSIYGSMEDNAKTTQHLMLVISGSTSYHQLEPMHKECLHMIFHKISRMVNGDPMYVDNATDIAGYATLLEKWLKEQ